QRVEQVGVALPAPRPAALAEAAVVLDRAIVDLDHHDLPGRDRFARPQADHGIEDGILGGSQVARMGPVPAQPGQRGDRQQRVEGEFQPQRQLRVGPPIATFERAPAGDEGEAGPGHRGLEPAREARRPAHSVSPCPTRATGCRGRLLRPVPLLCSARNEGPGTSRLSWGGIAMASNALVARVKGILLAPKAEWPVIAGEPATVKGLYVGYAMILAAIPAVAGFIKGTLIGHSLFGVTVTTPVGAGLASMVLGYELSLVVLYVVALVINALAPTFGAEKDQVQALKTATYAWTASWVAGIAVILPWIGWLLALAGG